MITVLVPVAAALRSAVMRASKAAVARRLGRSRGVRLSRLEWSRVLKMKRRGENSLGGGEIGAG